MVFDPRLTKQPAGALRPIIPDNACIPRITAAAGTELADAYSPGTVFCRPWEKEFTNHSPSSPTRCRSVKLRAHCGIFPTAASRRSLGRISVPVWLTTLSSQLLIVALVGHYPTSWLISHEPFPRRNRDLNDLLLSSRLQFLCVDLWGISLRFRRLSPTSG